MFSGAWGNKIQSDHIQTQESQENCPASISRPQLAAAPPCFFDLRRIDRWFLFLSVMINMVPFTNLMCPHQIVHVWCDILQIQLPRIVGSITLPSHCEWSTPIFLHFSSFTVPTFLVEIKSISWTYKIHHRIHGCWSKFRYLGQLQSPVNRESTAIPTVSIAGGFCRMQHYFAQRIVKTLLHRDMAWARALPGGFNNRGAMADQPRTNRGFHRHFLKLDLTWVVELWTCCSDSSLLLAISIEHSV